MSDIKQRFKEDIFLEFSGSKGKAAIEMRLINWPSVTTVATRKISLDELLNEVCSDANEFAVGEDAERELKNLEVIAKFFGDATSRLTALAAKIRGELEDRKKIPA